MASNTPEVHLSTIGEDDQSSIIPEREAQSPDHDDSTSISRSPRKSAGGEESADRSKALGTGLSTLLTKLIRDFDSNAVDTSKSQNQLSDALDRLTRELDRILENAPAPFIMQNAARISGARRRVSSLNLILKSILRRIDNIDRMLTEGIST